VRHTFFHTTNAARGREPCAASCGNENTEPSPLCVPCLRACYLRSPFIPCIYSIRDTVGLKYTPCIWCIRDTVGQKNIERRKLLLGAAALPLHHSVTTHTSINLTKKHARQSASSLCGPSPTYHQPAHHQNVNAKKQSEEEGGLAWALAAGSARATFSPSSY